MDITKATITCFVISNKNKLQRGADGEFISNHFPTPILKFILDKWNRFHRLTLYEGKEVLFKVYVYRYRNTITTILIICSGTQTGNFNLTLGNYVFMLGWTKLLLLLLTNSL